MDGLPQHFAALLRADAYPHPVQKIELVQTHVSWVILTGEWVYKIKRPVVFPFVDLRSAERRAFYCAEELRLNRRLAPQLYIDVCEITDCATGARIGGTGRIIEHAVKMLQFPRAQGLDRLLAEGKIEPNELERFGADLADLHDKLPATGGNESWGQSAAVRAAILENFKECEEVARVFNAYKLDDSLRRILERRLHRDQELFNIRRRSGFVRECHGDLHICNVVRFRSRLLAFDCMEFEPAFRWIDVAEEIAFLWMDLCRHGCESHGHAFLNGYLARSGDYHSCRLIRLYAAHCALVRAKVGALAISDLDDTREMEAARSRFSRYIEIAQDALSSKRPQLILMSGLSGSGKTWLARALAPQLNAIHLRSDVERKRLAGISEQDPSHSAMGSSLYSRDRSRQVYERLVADAGSILAGGFAALVDATFLKREDRERFSKLAESFRIRPILIQCHAPTEVLQDRIVRRAAQGTDPSEADRSVLAWQQSQVEAVEAREGFYVIDVDTHQPNVVERALSGLAH